MKDLNNIIITREAQGRNREVASEGSVEQIDEPMDKNVIGGAEGGRAGQGSRSPSGQTRCVNDAVVSRKATNLPGEASMDGRVRLKSAAQARSTVGSNVCGIIYRGVSRGRNSRGDELASGRTDSRSGEGLKPQRSELRSVATLRMAGRRESLCAVRTQSEINSILESRGVTAIKQTA